MQRLKSNWLSLILGLALTVGFVAYRTARADDDHNPMIHHAIAALRDAERELNASPNDFRGHKQDAMDAVHHAIDELDRIKDW
jgi:hypothetical protein